MLLLLSMKGVGDQSTDDPVMWQMTYPKCASFGQFLGYIKTCSDALGGS